MHLSEAHHAGAGVRDQHLRACRAEDHRLDLDDRAGAAVLSDLEVHAAGHPPRYCVLRV